MTGNSPRNTLRRTDRLRSGKDFRRVSRAGKRRSSAHFVVLTARGRGPLHVRLGLAVSRRVGNAVQRNRVKRRVRSWFRQQRQILPEASDVVVIARVGAAELSGRDVCRELSGLFE